MVKINNNFSKHKTYININIVKKSGKVGTDLL